MQCESLTNPLLISLFTHGSRRELKRRKNASGVLHEAIDFIRVFGSFGFANHPEKRLKYGLLLIAMLHPVFLPNNTRQTSSLSLKQGRTAWRIVLERLVDGNNF